MAEALKFSGGFNPLLLRRLLKCDERRVGDADLTYAQTGCVGACQENECGDVQHNRHPEHYPELCLG